MLVARRRIGRAAAEPGDRRRDAQRVRRADRLAQLGDRALDDVAGQRERRRAQPVDAGDLLVEAQRGQLGVLVGHRPGHGEHEVAAELPGQERAGAVSSASAPTAAATSSHVRSSATSGSARSAAGAGVTASRFAPSAAKATTTGRTRPERASASSPRPCASSAASSVRSWPARSRGAWAPPASCSAEARSSIAASLRGRSPANRGEPVRFASGRTFDGNVDCRPSGLGVLSRSHNAESPPRRWGAGDPGMWGERLLGVEAQLFQREPVS